MTYEVIYDPDEDCVYVRIEGKVDLATVHQYAREIIPQLSAHHCLSFLNDMRQVSVTLSTVDIYDLPAWIEEAGMDRFSKRALLLAGDFDDYTFFETVSRNPGQLVEVFADAQTTRVFRDIAEARAWLGLPTAEAASGRPRPPLRP